MSMVIGVKKHALHHAQQHMDVGVIRIRMDIETCSKSQD